MNLSLPSLLSLGFYWSVLFKNSPKKVEHVRCIMGLRGYFDQVLNIGGTVHKKDRQNYSHNTIDMVHRNTKSGFEKDDSHKCPGAMGPRSQHPEWVF